MTTFRLHHVALSVRDLDISSAFYRLFEFTPVYRMDAADLSILHVARPDGMLLELFCYPRNAHAERLAAGVGNDMEDIGVKHLAFVVDDLAAIREELSAGHHHVTEIRHGRANVDYCFVADPDGAWVEIVQDDRDLGFRQDASRSSAASTRTHSSRVM